MSVEGDAALKEWLVGQTIVKVDTDTDHILAITLSDDSTLIVETDAFAQGVPE